MRYFGFLVVAAGALAAFQIVSPPALAQEAKEGGTVIQVGPERGVAVEVNVDEEQAESRRERRRGRRSARPRFGDPAPVVVSRYWIGIGGGPLPAELRAQVDVEPGEGVLIRTVSPEGPAAEAGVEQFDILLRANGKPVSNLGEVAELVGEQGELKGRITFDLLRGGRPKTAWVTPIERPADLPLEDALRGPRRERFGWRFGPDGGLGSEGLFGPGGIQLDGEAFGGEAFGGFSEMIPEMAGAGVSVQVRRQNEGPAKVTVTQGDKAWEFDEGDAEALGVLPEDVRPMVERMLNGNGRLIGDDLDTFGFGGPGFQMQFGDGLAERMRAMQQRMMGMGANPVPAIQPPAADLDEAPAFGAEEVPEIEPEVAEEPIEIEIPGE